MFAFTRRVNSRMKLFYAFLACLLLLSSTAFAQRYKIIWSDEFDQAKLDTNTWTGWIGTAYNEEHQYYTRRDTNLHVNDGFLYLVGLRENYGGRQWTSGRIKSQDNFEFQYGRVEIRAKLPAGKGLWPAFWMLGSNINDIGWPYSGEIDIMEYRGNLANQTHGTVHFANQPPGSGDPNGDRRLIGHEYTLPSGSFAEDFHLFQFEWTDSTMTWFIDDVEFFHLTRSQIEAQTSYYPFDQPFYLILNLAIGGNFLGDQQPDASTPDRNEVIVDYVRVYQDANEEPDISTGFQRLNEVPPLEPVELEAEVTDDDGTITMVEFLIDEKIVGTDTETPYTATWLPKIDGCYSLNIKAYDNDNGVGRSTEDITFVVGTGCEQQSFHDEPASFPGTLQLEHFDYGGPGVSYHDTTPDTNLGNARGNDFRTTEAVDIIPDENEAGNYLLTETEIGEWTKYQLEVEESGIYDLEFRSGSGSRSARIDFELDSEEWIYFNRISDMEGSDYTVKEITDVTLHKGIYELTMFVTIAGGVQPDYLKGIFKEPTSTEETGHSTPVSIALEQNYPNPFNPSTQISFNLPKAQHVQLSVYNGLGQRLETLHSGRLNAGTHNIPFTAHHLSSGIYYYQLSTTSRVFTRKMVLMK